MDLIEKGIEYAKQFQKIIFNAGMAVFEKRELRNLKIYRLVVLTDGPDIGVFKNPLILTRLGNWILESSAEFDNTLLPLVLAALDERTGTYLVLGLAPRYPRGKKSLKNLTQDSTLLNTFSIAFQEVANSSNAKVRIDSFESSMIEIKKEDLSPFLEKLTLSGLI
jgi:cell division control protein 45